MGARMSQMRLQTPHSRTVLRCSTLDASALARLDHSIFSTPHHNYTRTEHVWNEFLTLQRHGAACLVVAFGVHAPLGVAALRYDLYATCGYLSLLGVLPRYQRRHVGSRLIAMAEQDATSRHCNGLYLRVCAENTLALSFYKARGYVVEHDASMSRSVLLLRKELV